MRDSWTDLHVVVIGSGPSASLCPLPAGDKYVAVSRAGLRSWPAEIDVWVCIDWNFWEFVGPPEGDRPWRVAQKAKGLRPELVHEIVPRKGKHWGMEWGRSFSEGWGGCQNSGYSALNYVWLRGCRNVSVIGFDAEQDTKRHERWRAGYAKASGYFDRVTKIGAIERAAKSSKTCAP